MLTLQQTKQISEVVGLKIFEYADSRYCLIESEPAIRYPYFPTLCDLQKHLASIVEKETEPEKVKKLCEIYQSIRYPSIEPERDHEVAPAQLANLCSINKDCLAALLREGGEKPRSPEEIVSTWPQWKQEILGGIGYKIDKAIAEHEKKMYGETLSDLIHSIARFEAVAEITKREQENEWE